MQRDKQFRVSGAWALASDGLQWIIQRRTGPDSWKSVKYINSDREWLAFRLRELAPKADAERLLEGLPDTFDEWMVEARSKASHDVGDGPGHLGAHDLAEAA
jgi:hypothetical protein